jgi:hypothetical protein
MVFENRCPEYVLFMLDQASVSTERWLLCDIFIDSLPG